MSGVTTEAKNRRNM